MSYTPTTWANGDTITAEKMNNIEQGVKTADMSYTPTTWANGDTITAEKMNNIEQGIVDASSGGDFSTAQVTFASNTGAVPVVAPCLSYDEGYVGVDILTEPHNGNVLTMPLYEGCAFVWPITNGGPPPSIEDFSASGAITIDADNNSINVAGDGTITYTAAN